MTKELKVFKGEIKMAKMNIAQLKKELKQFEQKELIQLIVDLSKLSDEVKNYLSAQLNGEEVIIELHNQAKLKMASFLNVAIN